MNRGYVEVWAYPVGTAGIRTTMVPSAIVTIFPKGVGITEGAISQVHHERRVWPCLSLPKNGTRVERSGGNHPRMVTEQICVIGWLGCKAEMAGARRRSGQ